MRPLHFVIGFCVVLLLLVSLTAGPFAFAGLLLLFMVLAAVIYIQTMNRQQQADAEKKASRSDDPGALRNANHIP